MTHEEVRELLPFYVAQTLDDEERRAVETALAVSNELRQELEFWKEARHATRIYSEMNAEEHLTSQQIVDYAEGTIREPEQRILIERHLQMCDSCSEEFKIAKELTPIERPEPVFTQPSWHEFASWFSGIRLAYLVGACALVAAFIFVQERKEPPVHTTVQPPQESVFVPKATGKRLAVLLHYSGGITRDHSSKTETQTLILDSGTTEVEFTIPVLYSAVASGYSVRLAEPAGTKKMIADSLIATGAGNNLDNINVVVSAAMFRQSGAYTLLVRELLKKGTEFDPETYEYALNVKRR